MNKAVLLDQDGTLNEEQALLVPTGYGGETERSKATQLHSAIVVDNLPAAADWILKQKPSP